MLKKIAAKAGAGLGLHGERAATPPRYRAVAPGLIVTDTDAWAWFEVPTTNSDLRGEVGRDAEQDQVEVALGVLAGRECHLRVVWGRVSGGHYLAGLGLTDSDPAPVREWAALCADSIDDLDLPTRRTLLGVKLTDRDRSARAGESLGLLSSKVTSAELARLTSMAMQVGRALRGSVLRVRMASSDLLAWSIAREMHRHAPVPTDDVIQGASLARLPSGHVQPYTDHLRVLGSTGAVAAWVAVLALTDFPEVLVTPGQEWLAVINGLETTPLLAGQEDPVQVLAEPSIRFRVLAPTDALARVDGVRKQAKEQRRSAAKGVAGEPPEHVLEAEAEAGELMRDLQRGRTRVIEDHPRVLVSSSTREELDAKVAALISAYADLGITAAVMVDEQREGWLESLPCDRVRVPDLGHIRDATAFAQSWFWGGCQVGSPDVTVPAIGYTTGSTQELVRFLATEGTKNQDAPVTVFTGRTRRGKTTAMMLSLLGVLLAPCNRDAEPWVVLPDLKGDADGLINAARHYGVRGDLIRVRPVDAGIFDTFAVSAAEHAVDTCASQLALLLPRVLAEQGGAYLTQAAAWVARNSADPATWQVVKRLVDLGQASTPDSVIHQVGETLEAATMSGWGRLVAGRPGPQARRLPVESGVTVIQVPGLTLPTPNQSAESWTTTQRASVAVLRGILGWCTSVGSAMASRRRAKVVAVPEVHLLTATPDGRVFLEQTARMGAAFGLNLMLDTQDVSGLLSLPGLIEGISSVFGFAQATSSEQDALARLLGLELDADTRAVVATLDRSAGVEAGTGEETIRRGHCLYRDRAGRVATIQWVVPSAHVQALLDTSAAATAGRAAGAPEPLYDVLADDYPWPTPGQEQEVGA